MGLYVVDNYRGAGGFVAGSFVGRKNCERLHTLVVGCRAGLRRRQINEGSWNGLGMINQRLAA